MTITQKVRKYRQLKATHRALKVFSKKINYKYIPVSGNSGSHVTNLVNLFEIRVGTDQPLEDMVITFAHELGHALDLVHTPMGWSEKLDRVDGKRDIQLVCREVAAWGFARKILKDMNCYKYVEVRFSVIKERALLTYVDSVEKAARAVNKQG